MCQLYNSFLIAHEYVFSKSLSKNTLHTFWRVKVFSINIFHDLFTYHTSNTYKHTFRGKNYTNLHGK